MRDRIQAQILECLARTGGAPWGLVVDAQDGTLAEFHHATEVLGAEGLLAIERGRVIPTAAGLQAANVAGAPIDSRCSTCDGRGYGVDGSRERLAELERLLTDRPPPRLDLDQGAITAEDCWLRAGFLRERGDLHGARILMVGDFDLISLALALVGGPERIVVLDLDERVVEFLTAAAAHHRLPIEARRYDVRRPLDADLVGAFDLFHCDPVETLEGIRLFLSRGCSGLRGAGAVACFGLTAIEASRAKWYDIQGLLQQMGFVVTDIRRRFSGYPDHDHAPEDPRYRYPVIDAMGTNGVEHRWYRSALLRAEAVRVPTPLVVGAVTLDLSIYVDAETWATPRTVAADGATLRPLGEGYDFRVFERPNGRLLRVPKRPEVAQHVAREVAHLAAVRRHLAVAVPDACLEIWDGVSSVGYPRLAGEPSDRVVLDAAASRRLAREVGAFLTSLHGLTPAGLGADVEVPLRFDNFRPWTRLEAVRSLGPYSALPSALAQRCERFLADESGVPADAPDGPGRCRLIHGDLEAGHLLIDAASGALVGVLDWSELGIADPARDIAGLWAYFGDTFLRDILDAYRLPVDPGFDDRVRFLGRCYALSAYDEALHGLTPASTAAAIDQLERVFAEDPR